MTKEWLPHCTWHRANSTFHYCIHYIYEIRNLATSGSQRQVVRQSGIVIS